MNPPTGLYRRDDRCQSKVEDQTVQLVLPPIDLAYIAAVLREDGFECKIRDYPAEKASWGEVKEDMKNPIDVLIIRVTAATFRQDIEACKLAKSLYPNILTIAFGDIFRELELFSPALNGHFTFDYIDYAIWGEPEGAIRSLLRGDDPSDIHGIIYLKKNNLIKSNGNLGTIPFDELPLPARDLLKNEIYLSPDTKKPITVIQTSRGCPYRCIFCPAYEITEGKVFIRSPQNIIKEIEECVQVYRIKTFLFNADTFTLNKNWVISLCKEIVERKLNIVWAANSRVDTIDQERLMWMKKAGCHIIGFGIESGSQEMLDLMGKKITLDDARKAIKLCREAGIKTHTFYILGLPWEKRETIEKTISFARELDADFFDFNLAFPLPGTEYYRIAKKDNLISTTLDHSGYGSSPVRSYYLTHNELLQWRKKALLSLYLRPSYIYRTLKSVITRPRELASYLQFGIKRLYQLLFH